MIKSINTNLQTFKEGHSANAIKIEQTNVVLEQFTDYFQCLNRALLKNSGQQPQSISHISPKGSMLNLVGSEATINEESL